MIQGDLLRYTDIFLSVKLKDLKSNACSLNFIQENVTHYSKIAKFLFSGHKDLLLLH